MLTRDLPRVTGGGLRLRYPLPRALLALTVDRLTAREVVDWVRWGDRDRWTWVDEYAVSSQRMEYDTRFLCRSSPLQPTALRLCTRTQHAYRAYTELPQTECPHPSYPDSSTCSAPIECEAVQRAPM